MYNYRKVTDDLYWVGGDDHRLSLFENIHPIYHGVSYNAYLLMDEKTVLVDTADWSVGRQFLDNVEGVLGERNLDFLLINHVEPDHAASIPEILLRWPNVKIITTEKAAMILRQFGFNIRPEQVDEVTEGDSRCFGKHTLAFVKAPMVHWPEAMVTFDTTSGVLFSADAFGSFRALDGKLFADEVEFDKEWLDDARRYYTNIVGKFGLQVMNIIKKLSGLDIELICALHGPLFRTKEDIQACIKRYQTWGSYTPEDDEVVIYSGSVYGHTEEFATLLATLLAQRGVRNTKVYDISSIDVSYLLSEAFRAKVLVFAASSYNGGIFTPMENFLMDLVAHNFQNRDVFVVENGSWALTAGKGMREIIGQLKKVNIADETISIKSLLKDAQYDEVVAMADKIVEDLKK